LSTASSFRSVTLTEAQKSRLVELNSTTRTAQRNSLIAKRGKDKVLQEERIRKRKKGTLDRERQQKSEYNQERDQKRKKSRSGQTRKMSNKSDPQDPYPGPLMETLSLSCKRLFEESLCHSLPWSTVMGMMLAVLTEEWLTYGLDKTDRRNKNGDTMYRPEAFHSAARKYLCDVEGQKNQLTMREGKWREDIFKKNSSTNNAAKIKELYQTISKELCHNSS